MSSQPHLQIFDPGHITYSKESSFSLFPLLPKELRLMVWRHALQRQRIIQLHLKSQRGQTVTQAAEGSESASKSVRYCALVDGCQISSKLLRVNRESREEASMFYRVRLPCTFIGEGEREPTAHETLLFNPEYDFLHINPEWPVRDTLLDFLYHLKTTHDPRHVGLLNLAVDLNALNGNDLYGLQPSDLEVEVRAAFVETLTQLHEVFFVSTPRAGRQVVGFSSGLPTSETMFNRSFPIMVRPPTFERLHHDPRPIAQDLKRVLTGTFDSRDMIQAWQQLLKKWRVSPPRIEYRFLLAFDPALGGGPISDRRSAKRWLQREDDQWNGRDLDDGLLKNKDIKWPVGPVGALHEDFKDEDLEKAVKPAFGFWLFPVDALGSLHEQGVSEGQGFRPRAKAILDMTKHWPELALSCLP